MTVVALTFGACGGSSETGSPSDDAGAGTGGTGSSVPDGGGAASGGGAATGGTGGAATGGTGGGATGGTGAMTAGGAGGGAAAGGGAGAAGVVGIDPAIARAFCDTWQQCDAEDFAYYYDTVDECAEGYAAYLTYLFRDRGLPCADALNAVLSCASMLSCDDFNGYSDVCDAEYSRLDTACY